VNLSERVDDALDALPFGLKTMIGVACSGGADSIALLHLAARRREIVAMHVDHGLRPSSAADAAFVEQHARALGIPFVVRRVHVERHGSLEAAARRARYDALEAMASETNVMCVLTAHTLDDQAETILLRLMRGDVLDGIAPVRGIFRRPLLDVRRDDLRAWLVQHDIAWREDPTNEDTRFERNWVRNVLLPQLEDRRENVSAVIARVAGRTRSDAVALDVIADEIFAAASIDDVGVFVAIDAAVPEAIASRVIRRAFRSLGHDPSEHDVLAALRTGRVRAGSVDVWRVADGCAFTRIPQPAMPTIVLPGDLVMSPDWQLAARIGEPSAPPGRWRIGVPERGVVAIRPRRAGDRVETRAGHRKVQDVLVDARVPRGLRDLVPIVTVDERPLAVVGAGAVRTGTMSASPHGRVIDLDPLNPTWSRELAWMGNAQI
jgi:tRNA(Ile)-lysidine synthase